VNRREVLKLFAGSTVGLLTWGRESGNRAAAADPTVEEIKSFFIAKDPAVMRLTEEVFRKCILGKVFPAEDPLKHNWIAPGGNYRGQWIWDTMFVVDLLSILPGKERVIRDVFQNYWDFQVRWNDRMPDYAHDMIPCMIEPGRENWVAFPAYSQIPILAWGVERVYRRNGDRELLEQCLDPLERFHEWYWRERDVMNIGLVAVGSYSSVPQHARFETFDYECNMDGLTMTAHPTRKSEKEGAWYGDLCVTGNTSYLILGERSLMRLAEIVGKTEMAARRKARIDSAVEAMRKHMWDEEAGTFLSVKRDTLEKIPVATIGSWIPLTAGVPTKSMANRMAEVLRTPSWRTPLPVPTVDRRDERWKSDGFWRGDVWPPTNYQIACGLADYGYRDLAADIADKTVANAISNGISEHYDSISGRKLGVEFLGMTCTILTMMLDGLCREHRLDLRQTG
jgi:hypothetical protein